MKKIILILIVALFANIAFAETVSRILIYNGPGNGLDQCNGILQDKFGKVYATGVSWGGSTTKEDYATVKFSEDGDFIWAARFDGAGHNLDYASAIAIDPMGNIYVTGWSRQGTSLTTEDYCTIKYNTNGVQQWVSFYNGGSGYDCEFYDHAVAIVVDQQGNVYVTGYSINGSDNEDYATVKYNTNGVQQWAKRYNGPSNLNDKAFSIFVDASGNVYVTGGSQQSSKGYDYLTIKYSSSGQQLWTVRYDAASKDDMARSLIADRYGNVYVTGSSDGGPNKPDYATIKYNSSGVQQWLQRYNGSANDTDIGTSIDLDVYEIPYVTGTSRMLGTNYDFYTVKYNPGDGSIMWSKYYSSGLLYPNVQDMAWKIKVVSRACATSGPGFDTPCWIIDVYVTGGSDGIGSGLDIATAHYSEAGDQKWANIFAGVGSSNDAAFDISVMDGYPIVYSGGILNNNYGIIGITDSRSSGNFDNKEISSCYPNPFNPETKINFNLKNNSFVKLAIYDALGREVALLVNDEYEKGSHSVTWNASGSTSGIYFYKIETAFGNETKKIVLIK